MSATAYWSTVAPRKGLDRERLMKGCGGRCFLMPKEKKFPICRRCDGRSCSCKPECSALRAARIRAAQWGYPEVYRRAKQMFDEQGCVWTAKKRRRM